MLRRGLILLAAIGTAACSSDPAPTPEKGRDLGPHVCILQESLETQERQQQ